MTRRESTFVVASANPETYFRDIASNSLSVMAGIATHSPDVANTYLVWTTSDVVSVNSFSYDTGHGAVSSSATITDNSASSYKLIESSTTDRPFLSYEYTSIFNTISEMASSDDEEICIDAKVAESVNLVAKWLETEHIQPPEIIRHGPGSAVFGWSAGDNACYLTVTANKAFGLVTDSHGVRGRKACILSAETSALGLLSIPFEPRER